MIRRALVILALTSLGAPGVALACSCVWGGPFTKVALGADVIVLGEVRAHRRHSMDLNVLEVLQGVETRETIRVWGDNGALCRPYVAAFPRGSRWILAVHRLRSPESSDYAISICGDFWLEVRGSEAVGRITVAEHARPRETVRLVDMLAWIRSRGATPIVPRPAS